MSTLHSSSSPTFPPASSLDSLQQIVTARSRYLCAFVGIFFYDWLSLLPLERRHIWKAKWSVGKILFLSLRYWSAFIVLCTSLLILLPVKAETCRRMFWLEPLGGMSIAFLSLLILSLRIVAIYKRTKLIVASMSVILAVVAAWMIYDITLFVAFQFPPPVADIIDFHGCIAAARDAKAQRILTSLWTVPLAADLAFVCLTVHQSRILYKQSIGSVNPPLARKIMSSGILYYLFITTSNLVNTILYSIPNRSPTFKVFHASASDVLTSLLTARLVLHLFENPTPAVTKTSSGSGARRQVLDAIELRTTCPRDTAQKPGWNPQHAHVEFGEEPEGRIDSDAARLDNGQELRVEPA